MHFKKPRILTRAAGSSDPVLKPILLYNHQFHILNHFTMTFSRLIGIDGMTCSNRSRNHFVRRKFETTDVAFEVLRNQPPVRFRSGKHITSS